MRVKVLLPPEGKHGSYIVAVNGELRVIDRPSACKGFQNGCVGNDCRERASLAQALAMRARGSSGCCRVPKPVVCECDHPLPSDGDCIKCGRSRQNELPEAA